MLCGRLRRRTRRERAARLFQDSSKTTALGSRPAPGTPPSGKRTAGTDAEQPACRTCWPEGTARAVQLAPSRFSGHHQRRRCISDQRCGRPTLCLSDDARSRRGARESRVEVVLGVLRRVITIFRVPKRKESAPNCQNAKGSSHLDTVTTSRTDQTPVRGGASRTPAS